MGNKMLIDAAHPEETRVVVLRGNRVEEFDFEAQSRKQLRGSIFLAKVIRVEPSLQAAFVDYGGNRHGFLAFSEIHPDYYRIPYADAQSAKTEAHKAAQPRETVTEDDQPKAKDSVAAPESEAGTAAGTGTQEGDVSPSAPEAAMAETEAVNGTVLEAAKEAQPGTGAEEAFVGDEPTGTGSRARSIALEAAIPSKVSKALEEIPQSLDAQIGGTAPENTALFENEDVQAAEPSNAVLESSTDISDINVEESAPTAGDDSDDSLTPEEAAEHAAIESVGGEDVMEELPQRERPRRRLYKIQEVIKRNQILLVQVVKEERGTKGAALTTYLSLAGRYTVLMPNTGSGGGISRKITVATDRKRLREIATELDVPPGMGLIVRTAGASRTKAEIKRDFEYLLRLWENVRELTLKSKAPTLVYEEGDLIKRSIRDLYNREIDEILVAGDDAYRDAKDFMRMLMPSHAKNVQPYKEAEPIFTKYNVEAQLNMLFNPRVTLKSGGYIIINQTEALVAIDVNSGKSTREHSIEETALKTNLEAAEEIARQLRLRDLAGLIVIDFIDMEEKRNNRAVERKLKDCLRNDRARIQVGRISPFGLLEMSRQRLRTGMVEGSTKPCHFCDGTGVIRSTESVALMVLRAIEDHLIAKGPANLAATTSVDAALYILNNKRGYLKDIETRYGVSISILAAEHMHGAAYTIEKLSSASPRQSEQSKSIQMTWAHVGEDETAGDAADAEPEHEMAPSERSESRSRRRRRRRRFRGAQENGADHRGAYRETEAQTGSSDLAHGHYSHEANGLHGLHEDAIAPENGPNGDEDAANGADFTSESQHGEGSFEEPRRSRRSRRRGRRGGHRQRALHSGDRSSEVHDVVEPGMPDKAVVTEPSIMTTESTASEITPPPAESPAITASSEAATLNEVSAELRPERKPRNHTARRGAVQSPGGEAAEGIHGALAAPETGEAASIKEHAPADMAAPAATPLVEQTVKPAVPLTEEEPKPRKVGPIRAGWWQRRIGG